MINPIDRLRTLFASSRHLSRQVEAMGPDPEWDELVSWAVTLPAADGAVPLARAAEVPAGEVPTAVVENDESAEWEWAIAVARAKSLALAADPSPRSPVTVAKEVAATVDRALADKSWTEDLAQARARRLTEDAEWSACLARAKASRERELDVQASAEDAEWLACLARAKAVASPAR
jgi:hypothetical protein